MVLCQIIKLSIPAHYFLWLNHIHIYIPWNTLSLLVQAVFVVPAETHTSKNTHLRVQREKERERNTFYAVIHTQTITHHHTQTLTHTSISFYIKTNFSKHINIGGGMQTHTHTPFDIYPVAIGCTDQSL